MRLVYVNVPLGYKGTGEVLRSRRDGRLVVETPDGRRIKAHPQHCRDMERPAPASAPLTRRGKTGPAELRAVPKPDAPVRNPAYLRWLRERGCALCGICVGVQASHHPSEMGGTLSRKCSDLRAIPLCAFHHAQHHSKPLDREWVEESISAHLRLWVRTLGPEEVVEDV